MMQRTSDDSLRRAFAAPLSEEGRAQIVRLTDENRHLREKAAGALGRMGGVEAVEALLAGLGDEEARVRSAVVQALGQIGDARAVEAVCGMLADPSHFVRIAAAWALERLGDRRAVAPLCVALQDTDSAARSAAAWVLGILGDARAIEPLCAALQDTEVRVRSSAARALGQIGKAQALEGLCAALQDADFSVRLAAVKALRQLEDTRVVEALCTALREEHPSVRLAAAQALGSLGDVRAVGPLCTAYQSDPGFSTRAWTANGDFTMKGAAASALWEIGGMPALPVRILADAALTPGQKLDALEGLMQVKHTHNPKQRDERPIVIRYALGSVPRFCEPWRGPGEEAEAAVRSGAEAVLTELRNRADATILLRASTRDDVREKQELLRGVSGQPDTTPPEELLRPSGDAVEPTLASEPPEQAAEQTGWWRWILRRKKQAKE